VPRKKVRRRPKKQNQQYLTLNAAIGIVGVLLLGFIYSFSQNSSHRGIPIEVKFPNNDKPRRLAAEIHDLNPIQDIKVEVLNGCGIKGIAAKASEYLLLEYQIDVVRADNADNHNYQKTLIILRNEKLDAIELIKKSFGIAQTNDGAIQTKPDESLGVDLTIIIGKDIHTYSNVFDFITEQN
tara:strand:- start:148 stop:693 length:546 start_codon:yes stop_codon:yes gene_type:complete